MYPLGQVESAALSPQTARWLSALALLGVFSVSVLECIQAHGYMAGWQLLALSTLVWLTALASLLLLSARWWTTALLMALLLPLSVIEAWLLVVYHAQLNGHTLTVMLATDRIEAQQYVSTATWLIAGTALVTLVGIWSAWSLRRHRLLRDERRAMLPGAVMGWFAIGALLWLWAPPELTPNNGDVVSPTARTFERVFPWGVPVRLLSYVREQERKVQFNALAADFRFGASAPADPRVVVLVLGESSRASNWQLGGYPRATNPQLMARRDVIWLKDYAANAVATTLSVPLMITRKPTELGGDAAWPERSTARLIARHIEKLHVLSLPRVAGNQQVVLASRRLVADPPSLVAGLTKGANGAYDYQLVPEVDKALKSGATRQFIVVHLMGSHHVYAERYPPGEAFFVPDEGANSWGNAYDNSIRHTDQVLAALIASLERTGRPSTLIYASDHGELLKTATCTMQWHGHGAQENVFASSLVWLSPHAENAPYARAARQNALLATSSKDLFDSLVSAGRLKLAGAHPQSSWLSAGFVVRARLVSTFEGVKDADGAPSGACGLLPSVAFPVASAARAHAVVGTAALAETSSRALKVCHSGTEHACRE